MRIIIVNGSLRKNGATAYFLHRVEKTLAELGAEVVFYDLTEQNIALCKGCCACYKVGGCVIDDDGERISRELRTADGVVLGSSTIASNVSAVMKLFIDRAHFVIEQLLYGKYAFCVATYENYGGGKALKVLTDLVKLSGAALSGAVAEKLPFNSANGGSEKINEKADRYARKLFSDIENRKPYRVQKMIHKIVQNVGIKPLINRKGDAYAAVRRRWTELELLK